MFDATLLTKVLLPYKVLTKEQANILYKECFKARVSPEFYFIYSGILNKEQVIQLNLFKENKNSLTPDEVKSFFNTEVLEKELIKVSENGIKANLYSKPEIDEKVGKYILKELKEKNAIFETYKAVDSFTGNYVSLKILSPQLIFDDITVQDKFLDEVEKVKVLNNQNIVKVIDSGKNEKYTYVVMEYFDSVNLENYVENSEQLTELKVIDLALLITDVLDYSYRKFNIVHRDINPKKILIDKQNNIKICDFEFAKIVNEPNNYQTISGQVYETPYYMAPEQLMVQSSRDFRSDMYSLGVTLYQLLTNKLPFYSENITEIIMMHITKKPEAPNTIANIKSNKLSEIIMKLLNKDINSRYKDYSELTMDLLAAKNEFLNKKVVFISNFQEKVAV